MADRGVNTTYDAALALDPDVPFWYVDTAEAIKAPYASTRDVSKIELDRRHFLVEPM